MLVVFGGLPGVGKSTIAAMLARRLLATYLRIDTIEQALRACATLPGGVVAEGYAVAYLVAEDNLRVGGTVVADSVNPLPVTRDAWLAVANRARCSSAGGRDCLLGCRGAPAPGRDPFGPTFQV